MKKLTTNSNTHTHQPHLLLFFFYYSITLYSHAAAITNPNHEASTLLSIKSNLSDPLHHLSSWTLTNTSHYCTWTGITCNQSTGFITSLNLSNMNLSGILSNNIQYLTSLTTLDISQNYFTSNFPPIFTSLPYLTHLNASGNDFTGSLPLDLVNATSLLILDLRGCSFTGSIPSTYNTLIQLQFLGLSGNNLTGPIPSSLGELTSLTTLILGYNSLSGEIPIELGNLTNLQYLDLAISNLTGSIPTTLSQLRNLTTLFLYKNRLTGSIPDSFGNLTSLTLLDISDNHLSGSIPVSLTQLPNLELLNLMCNRFTGPIPSSLGQSTTLRILALWNNSLSGQLPTDLGLHSPLQWLDVSTNSFTGTIPSSLCYNNSLTKLILFNNRFTGPIPSNLTTCTSLIRVRIHNNHLSGSIPPGFEKLTQLQRLELANNNLTGQIPADISSSTSLSFIDVSDNRLQSHLPSTILSAPNLQAFKASNNLLSGEIPDQFQDCPSLSTLDLSTNRLTGIIPSSIGSCEKMVTLILKNNQLSGEIPESVANMPALSVLDLSHNNLTGKIPSHFGSSPALESLNVSHNNLVGEVPSNGILKTINPSDLEGNPGLCGRSGSAGGVLPLCPGTFLDDESDKKNSKSKLILTGWIAVVFTIFGIGIAVFGIRILYKKWYVNGGGNCCFDERFDMGKKNGGNNWPWRLIAFQRIGFNANDILACVKESNVIGMGANGVVYKAELPDMSTAVAVKKLWKKSDEEDVEKGISGSIGSGDLRGEVGLLGKLRHRNIVRLLGLLHNNREGMMVYEYMENGSLGDALHGKQASKRFLIDWVTRYNIAVGVAQGLAYLHHDCHPPVIHRDVKSNNILLDANLDAKVADFGLARIVMRKNETLSMIAGSHGYIAPEYAYTLKVDEKGDIYAYGVVLLELVTGKKPVEKEFGESGDLVGWVRDKIKNNRPVEEEVLDANVGGSSKHVQEEMNLVLRIALLCTAKLPKERPSMRDVITMLGEAKPRRKSSSSCCDNGESDASSRKDKEKEKNKPVFSTSPVNALL